MQLDELKTLHGLFLLDKPAGISSFGLLENFKFMLAREINLPAKYVPKMGHGGTLDPFATGLLVVCFNDGVKLSRYYLDSSKTYLATLKWGETTASGDFTNEITERTDRVPSSREEIQAAADAFRAKPYDQIPPMHSAKKIGGQTLYKLARQGLEVERVPKRCEIRSLEVLEHDPVTHTSRILCEVTAGTYIRTLAQDLAVSMGSLAALTELRRTASGKFSLERATSLEDALSLKGFVPMSQALPHLVHVPVTPEESQALREGRQEGLGAVLQRAKIAPAELSGPSRVALYDGETLLGIAAEESGTWGIERIFART